MILFIIGALFALIALAVLIFSDDAKRAAIIPAVVAVIFIGISCVSYVPTGYTGIVTTFGKVEDGTKDAGVVFKAPWQSIVKMDNRVQEMSMDLSAFSSDIQEVSTSVAVGYRINQANAMTIYKEVGNSYGVRPALYFPSTLWVSTEDEGEAGFCLADVPLDDLLAEIKSRAEE